MKRLKDISIGGVAFLIEEDAYTRLRNYLEIFANSIPNSKDRKEVMEEVEFRMAEILQSMKKTPEQFITATDVDHLINQFGKIEDINFSNVSAKDYLEMARSKARLLTSKRLFRDPNNSVISGVCGGLAIYFGMDVVLVRIIFVLLFIFAGITFWVYIILWIILPKAKTIVQKLEMYGIPVTEENIKEFKNRQG